MGTDNPEDSFDLEQTLPPGAGVLLVASPNIPPCIFHKSVVLLCEHNDSGSFGLLLNVPTHVSVGSVDKELDSFRQALHQGGPVQVNSLHFIHNQISSSLESKEVFPGVYWGQDYESLVDYSHTQHDAHESFRFMAGYSGWGDGQLEEEIDRQDWFLTPATPDAVFYPEINKQWDYVMRSMGAEYEAIADLTLAMEEEALEGDDVRTFEVDLLSDQEDMTDDDDFDDENSDFQS